jgi:putative membrane protein
LKNGVQRKDLPEELKICPLIVRCVWQIAQHVLDYSRYFSGPRHVCGGLPHPVHMIKKIIIGVVLNSVALYAVTYFMTDIHYTGGILFFVISGFIIGVLNVFVKPLMKALSFPLMIMTVGLFTLVINAIIFWLTMKIVNGIHVADVTVEITGAVTYLVAAVVFGIVNWVLHIFIRNK